ncbi:Metal-dependent hydrolase, endonuclease/exonuclease/phosphatase family [Loktanella fryxellensis]|uniref:Metal-dependent hydrolase, endonuclease/exonuclease/phosphatase family n=1 Tax=Loktanella fryxellensis TaxID=245187 RepID=A0A1H8JSG6_9RHOB|nr:endonuclease/exonuclease/phosphatase family protein [Loktanella fryxellensis]SEN83670.1 Metal-dependent hydrolase, endonuclease/exonuclease/phosphatase family [Loktanella fryxellensis]
MRHFLTLLTALVLFGCTAPEGPALSPPPPGSVRVATHNVHYIVLNEATGPWSVGNWEDRRTALDAAFKAVAPDIIAFQEMESFARGDDGRVNLARDWLLAQNPGYAAGASGDSRTFPSTQPILYRTDRFTLLNPGWFFFSDTPDVIYSRTFDGSYPAFASTVRLADADGTVLNVVNVHFEYKSGSNRTASARLVAERMAPLIAAGERVVLTGDLNAMRGSPTADILRDAGFTFLPVTGSTYHFDRGINLFGAIDHIALSGPLDATGPVQVLRQRFMGRWPSDHYPVVADITLR